MYQPTLGRFLSVDPLSREGPDFMTAKGFFGERMQEMWDHPFVYTGNNPTVRVDPSGLSFCSSVCPDKCTPEHDLRGLTVPDIRLHNRLSGSPPNRADGLSVATSELIRIIEELAEYLPGGGLPGSVDLIDQLVKQANLAVDKAMALGEGLDTVNGVAIWLKLRGQCCEKVRCKIVCKRLDWKTTTGEEDGWTKCSASSGYGSVDFPGFKYDDAAGIKDALPDCITTALQAFTCPDGIDDGRPDVPNPD